MKRMARLGSGGGRSFALAGQAVGAMVRGGEINFIWCFGKLLVEFLILQASFFTTVVPCYSR